MNAGFDESDPFNYRHISALIDAAGDFGRLSAECGADIIFFAAGADGHIKDRRSHLQYHEGLLIKVFGSIFQYDNLRKLPVLIGGAGGYRPDDATPAMWAEAVKCVASEKGCWI